VEGFLHWTGLDDSLVRFELQRVNSNLTGPSPTSLNPNPNRNPKYGIGLDDSLMRFESERLNNPAESNINPTKPNPNSTNPNPNSINPNPNHTNLISNPANPNSTNPNSTNPSPDHARLDLDLIQRINQPFLVNPSVTPNNQNPNLNPNPNPNNYYPNNKILNNFNLSNSNPNPNPNSNPIVTPLVTPAVSPRAIQPSQDHLNPNPNSNSIQPSTNDYPNLNLTSKSCNSNPNPSASSYPNRSTEDYPNPNLTSRSLKHFNDAIYTPISKAANPNPNPNPNRLGGTKWEIAFSIKKDRDLGSNNVPNPNPNSNPISNDVTKRIDGEEFNPNPNIRLDIEYDDYDLSNIAEKLKRNERNEREFAREIGVERERDTGAERERDTGGEREREMNPTAHRSIVSAIMRDIPSPPLRKPVIHQLSSLTLSDNLEPSFSPSFSFSSSPNPISNLNSPPRSMIKIENPVTMRRHYNNFNTHPFNTSNPNPSTTNPSNPNPSDSYLPNPHPNPPNPNPGRNLSPNPSNSMIFNSSTNHQYKVSNLNLNPYNIPSPNPSSSSKPNPSIRRQYINSTAHPSFSIYSQFNDDDVSISSRIGTPLNPHFGRRPSNPNPNPNPNFNPNFSPIYDNSNNNPNKFDDDSDAKEQDRVPDSENRHLSGGLNFDDNHDQKIGDNCINGNNTYGNSIDVTNTDDRSIGDSSINDDTNDVNTVKDDTMNGKTIDSDIKRDAGGGMAFTASIMDPNSNHNPNPNPNNLMGILQELRIPLALTFRQLKRANKKNENFVKCSDLSRAFLKAPLSINISSETAWALVCDMANLPHNSDPVTSTLSYSDITHFLDEMKYQSARTPLIPKSLDAVEDHNDSTDNSRLNSLIDVDYLTNNKATNNRINDIDNKLKSNSKKELEYEKDNGIRESIYHKLYDSKDIKGDKIRFLSLTPILRSRLRNDLCRKTGGQSWDSSLDYCSIQELMKLFQSIGVNFTLIELKYISNATDEKNTVPVTLQSGALLSKVMPFLAGLISFF
jgi:hypothetical protein